MKREIYTLKKWCDENLPSLSWNMLILQKLNLLRRNQNELWLSDLLDPTKETKLTARNYYLLKKGIKELANYISYSDE